jgi:hypothetical protein
MSSHGEDGQEDFVSSDGDRQSIQVRQTRQTRQIKLILSCQALIVLHWSRGRVGIAFWDALIRPECIRMTASDMLDSEPWFRQSMAGTLTWTLYS